MLFKKQQFKSNFEKLKSKIFAYNEKIVLEKFCDPGANFCDKKVIHLHSYDGFKGF